MSRLIDQAQGGQVVTITRDGKPAAELRALDVAPKRQSSAHLIDETAARAKLRPWLGKSAMDSFAKCATRSREILCPLNPIPFS